MIEIIVLILTMLLLTLVAVIVIRAIIKKESIIGRPPVPVFFFIMAKLFVVINLSFLVLKGLKISVPEIFHPGLYIELFAVALLICGIIIIFLSTIQLKKDLIFGLSSTGNHNLQTQGVYSFSRHPFYLGFLFILFSSCLLSPHVINIISFLGAWIIHHFIMIKEEEYLGSQYGDQYIQYKNTVKRYITL
jgi:protein-S-isoprenylcysteine O-methyltransferase Ste14